MSHRLYWRLIILDQKLHVRAVHAELSISTGHRGLLLVFFTSASGRGWWGAQFQELLRGTGIRGRNWKRTGGPKLGQRDAWCAGRERAVTRIALWRDEGTKGRWRSFLMNWSLQETPWIAAGWSHEASPNDDEANWLIRPWTISAAFVPVEVVTPRLNFYVPCGLTLRKMK